MDSRLRRYRVNVNFRGLRHGELIDVDPDEWLPYIENGWLTIADVFGEQELVPLLDPIDVQEIDGPGPVRTRGEGH